jgi:hypothetical protein
LEAGARTGKSTDDPRAGMGVGDPGDPMFTLQAGKQHAVLPPVPIQDAARPDKGQGGTGIGQPGDAMYTLTAQDQHGVVAPAPQAFYAEESRADNLPPEGTAPPVKTTQTVAVVHDARGNGDGQHVPTLTGDHASRPTDYTPLVFTPGNLKRGAGPSPSEEAAPTLQAQLDGRGASDQQPHALAPEAFRKSKRAASDKDDEKWVEADHANTLNEFDCGKDKRATEVVVGAEPQALDPYNQKAGAATHPLRTATGDGAPVVWHETVRRLTPTECERLQGFPDGYTLIEWSGSKRDDADFAESVKYLMDSYGWPRALAERLADTPDGPRYKALGNSMATVCMRWIGQRIQEVDAFLAEKEKKAA